MTKVPSIAFVANSRKFLIISLVILAAVLVASFTLGVGLDIQFSGGAIITFSYQGEVDPGQFAQTAQDLTGAVISVQQTTDLATGMETLVLSLPGGDSLTSDQMAALTQGLAGAFPENAVHAESISNVSATMGAEFLAKCLVAVAFASLLMIIYVGIRFKRIGGFSAGVMAVLALIHDVLIVFGVHVLLGIPLSGNFIAVVLTILGYSVNNTIVIYDRVRENKRLYGNKLSLAELVDRSINQSLRRSINTSITTVGCMVVVAVVSGMFGVTTIVTFAVPMIIGLAAGLYTSLCIAGPLWVRWRERAAA